jgi:hypothetical protein
MEVGKYYIGTYSQVVVLCKATYPKSRTFLGEVIYPGKSKYPVGHTDSVWVIDHFSLYPYTNKRPKQYANGYQSKIEYWSAQLVEAVKSGQREGIERAKSKLDYFVHRQLETTKS